MFCFPSYIRQRISTGYHPACPFVQYPSFRPVPEDTTTRRDIAGVLVIDSGRSEVHISEAPRACLRSLTLRVDVGH